MVRACWERWTPNSPSKLGPYNEPYLNVGGLHFVAAALAGEAAQRRHPPVVTTPECAQLPGRRMSSPRRILVLFAHPAFQKSRINRPLAAAARQLPGVTFRDLYEEYPQYQIDVAREQSLLIEHDVIVFQHPFYWYSCPALLKEWLDLVLEHGFAYGAGGTRLENKLFMSALTTGGPEAAYSRDGYNRFTMRELLAPFEQTASLCGMIWLPPFVIHGSIRLTDPPEIAQHVADYTRILTALRDRTLPTVQTAILPRINTAPSAPRA